MSSAIYPRFDEAGNAVDIVTVNARGKVSVSDIEPEPDMTNAELAEAYGVSVRTVYRWQQRARESLAAIEQDIEQQIAAELEVNPDYGPAKCGHVGPAECPYGDRCWHAFEC